MPTSKKNHSEPLSFRTRLKVFVTAYEALRDANKPAGVNSTQWISEAADLHERGSIGDAGAFDLIRSRFQEALNTPEHKKLANRSSSFRSSSFDIEEDTISLVTGYHTGTHLIEYGFVRITVSVRPIHLEPKPQVSQDRVHATNRAHHGPRSRDFETRQATHPQNLFGTVQSRTGCRLPSSRRVHCGLGWAKRHERQCAAPLAQRVPARRSPSAQACTKFSVQLTCSCLRALIAVLSGAEV